MKPESSGKDFLATCSLCFVIAFAPLPFGSVDAATVAVWVILLAATLAIAALAPITRRDLPFFIWLGVVTASWLAVVALQMGYGPASLRPAIWDQTAALLGHDMAGKMALADQQPYLSAGFQIVCLLSLTAGYLVGRDSSAAHLLMKTFAASGLLYAIYGIVAFIFWPSYWLWHEKLIYRGSLTATFINPNVTAVYFGACTVVWTLLLAKALRSSSARLGRPVRSLFASLFDRPSREVVVCFVSAFVTLSAMFSTGSRAGSVFSLVAIAGAATTFYLKTSGAPRITFRYFILSVALVLLTLQVLGPRVNQRFDLSGLSDSGRWAAYQSTIGIISDYPWLGTGLGTFRWAFTHYRAPEISIVGIWDRAHSTPLELASEMGIPFAALIIVGWLAIFIKLTLGMRARKRDQILPISAFWVGILAIFHSQIDFSMQIPGLSIIICSLTGMGIAQSNATKSLSVNHS